MTYYFEGHRYYTFIVYFSDKPYHCGTLQNFKKYVSKSLKRIKLKHKNGP